MNENQKKHLDSRFYKEAENYRECVRVDQILKGAEKYPEPLNPRSWSVQQLVEHATQENVDQFHYIYALGELNKAETKERDDKLDKIIKALEMIGALLHSSPVNSLVKALIPTLNEMKSGGKK